MDKNTFIDHLREAIESLENDLRFDGPYADEFEPFDGGVVIPFDDGSKFRVTIDEVKDPLAWTHNLRMLNMHPGSGVDTRQSDGRHKRR